MILLFTGSNNVLASRKQFPIRVAYDLTLTIDRVLVHGEHGFLPGQLWVGMGRVRDPAGLQIVGFRPATCQAHPPDVVDFHYGEPIPIYEDNGYRTLRTPAPSYPCLSVPHHSLTHHHPSRATVYSRYSPSPATRDCSWASSAYFGSNF